MFQTMTATLLCILALPLSGRADAFFQFAIPTDTNDHDLAFLWIPPEAPQIRGSILAGMTLMEQHFVKDPMIRAACAEQQLALIFLTRGTGEPERVQRILDNLAAVSGYQELSVVPLMFVGHSAGGPPAQKLATEMGDRCFGLVQYRGGMPSGDHPIPAGIPSVAMMAQFDEFWGTMRNEEGFESWERALNYIRGFRAAGVDNLGSFVVEPGAGHFAWSDRNARYLELFIRKAAQARIPAEWPVDAEAPAALLDLDPSGGWLTGFDLKGNPECAAFPAYQGDKTEASWHVDEEMARATMAYHKGLTGRNDQFIRWEDPHWVDAGARFFFTRLTWVDDGQTLQVHPVYAEKVPSQYNGQGPRWPNAGNPVGNAATPIHVKPVAGPLVAVGNHKLRVQYDALSPAGSRTRMSFLAYSEGDERYRYTEQVGMLPRGFHGLNGGRAQTLSFPELKDVAIDAPPQQLYAKSDAGVPVEYYVDYGPAVIENGHVVLRDIPLRARFPIEVKLTAYHFGSGVEPKLQTATPVARTFQILR